MITGSADGFYQRSTTKAKRREAGYTSAHHSPSALPKDEAAEYCGISTSTLGKHGPPPTKIGDQHCTTAASIERMAAAERLNVAADAFAPVVPDRGFGWVFVRVGWEADFPNTDIEARRAPTKTLSDD
jgi:hypothetical protein